ncbi:hypothetical protein RR48_00273 [Papilio machaon]|uniref:Uncharacterized protein n=1 Tax=Papilio machaon TaxID=76193 RepID=A0A0N0PFM9_PAPMA|nr:hypothetical protein RR48_00273 [Papilio machaon]
MQNRRSQSANSASSGNTIASNSSKRPRKRKSTEPSMSECTRSGGVSVKAQVGDKLKVYYGPTQSESKVHFYNYLHLAWLSIVYIYFYFYFFLLI